MPDLFYHKLWTDKILKAVDEARKSHAFIVDTVDDYSDFTLNKDADSLIVPKIGALKAVKLPANDSDINDPSKDTMIILFNQAKGAPFLIKNIEASQSSIGLMNHYTNEAKSAILKGYDTYLMTEMLKKAKTKLVKPSGNEIVKNEIKLLMTALDKAGAPKDDRYLLVSAETYSQIIDIKEFVSRDYIADAKTMKTGILGQILGFSVIMPPELPKVNNAGIVSEDGTKDVLLAYQKSGYGFARQQEFKASAVEKPLTPATLVNVWSVFGGNEQFPDYMASMRDN